ncbi:MAG: hypothetical protein HY005_02275 [Candidatus Staskawiczbacteria bacterium]|nr:hypothetical protein [Candidatus Staskawiczbacteria bacterium]MBI3337429.1 hypothetical protein [Candidatus Staskawiczbacteria bacterium]
MLKSIIPGPDKLTKKAVMTAITVPEGLIMLIIAVFLDLIGIVFFILSFFGVGIPLSFLLDILGMITIGFWATTRSLFRGVVEKAVEDVTEKVLNVGGGLEEIKNFQGGSAPGAGASKKIAKTGANLGLSAVRFIISSLVELVPFLGDITPGWTIFVIFELVQGEI